MAREKQYVLVVEDEAKLRRLIELQLVEDGFLVHAAPDAETALEYFRKEPFDLVVTDFKLPGMTGLEFLQATRTINANIPVIMMRSEEHTSELQSPVHLVCRLLLEKKKKIK